MKSGLEAMGRFLSVKGTLGAEAQKEARDFRDLVTTYLTTALAPSSGTTLSVGAERRLRTLTEGLDALVTHGLVEVKESGIELEENAGWPLTNNKVMVFGGPA